MWRMILVLVTAGLVLAAAGIGVAETVNESAVTAGGLYWSTAKEEGDLSPGIDIGDSDGGFSSLDGMLQWAIGQSDPTKLKEKAEEVKLLSTDELKQRQMEIKDLMERLKTPSDAQLMQTAIDDLNNSTLSLEDHLHALQELLILVEPIDNANDLPKLGGLTAVIKELNHSDLEMRTTSAWVLGKACQNNPVLQKQLLQLDALTKLMKMMSSDFVEEAIKALYAVSALIRNSLEGQEIFYKESGVLILQEILSNSSADVRLRRKAVFLVADLAAYQLETENNLDLDPPSFSNQFFRRSIVDLLASNDIDLQEKALHAIKNLLMLKSTQALVFKEFCELDVALEKMERQLQLLQMDENLKEYALDLESLRREVLQLFLEKLDKEKKIPVDLGTSNVELHLKY